MTSTQRAIGKSLLDLFAIAIVWVAIYAVTDAGLARALGAALLIVLAMNVAAVRNDIGK